MMNNYYLFLAITFMAALTPGPAVLLAIRNGALYGFKRTFAGILGNISAVFILATLSIMGVGLLLSSSSQLLFWLKAIGGGYLLYLGIRCWNVTSGITTVTEVSSKRTDINACKLYGEAFMVGISNPKAILFFTALFPQFIDPTKSTISALLPLVLGCCVCSFICLILYASVSLYFAKHIQHHKVGYWFTRILGLVFILFGTMLLVNSI